MAEGTSRTRPRYELQPYLPVLTSLQARNSSVINWLRIEKPAKLLYKSGAHWAKSARLLEYQGIVFRHGTGLEFFTPNPPEADSKGELIWLPNTLVTGTVNGDSAPVRRLRQRGDLSALRLLVDLYHAHNLSADGGISRRVLSSVHSRKEVAHIGRRIVWGFGAAQSTVNRAPSTDAFWTAAEMKDGDYFSANNKIWEAVHALEDLGLLSEVTHLVENSKLDSEPIHGFAWDEVGEPLEYQLAEAAQDAAMHLLGDRQFFADRFLFVAPVWDSLPDVQAVGVYRLTYRPQTRLTSDWYRQMASTAAEWFQDYAQIIGTSSQNAGLASAVN